MKIKQQQGAIIFVRELKYHQSHLITMLISPQTLAGSYFVAQG